MAALPDLDRDALRKGIAVAGAVAVPVALLSSIIVGNDPDNRRTGPAALFTVMVLVALVLGARVAATHQSRNTPLTHGLVTALVVVVLLAVIRIIRLAMDGEGPGGGIIGNVILGLICGLVGGLLGSRRSDPS
jgi:putative membrane protein (TIGR04086 family)